MPNPSISKLRTITFSMLFADKGRSWSYELYNPTSESLMAYLTAVAQEHASEKPEVIWAEDEHGTRIATWRPTPEPAIEASSRFEREIL